MWIMEQPHVILMGGGAIAAMLLAGLIQTGKKPLLFAAIGVVLGTLGLFALERITITPREEVRATLHVIAHELEQNDVEGVLGYISDGRPKLKREARQKMGLVEISEVDIKRNLKIEIVSSRGVEVAEARFNCVIHFSRIKVMSSISDNPQRYPRFFVVRFRRDDDGRWRIRDYEMQDPRRGIGG